MTTTQELFEQGASAMAGLPGVERNRRGNLTIEGGVRAMTSGGRIVVCLPVERVRSRAAAVIGEHYKGQTYSWFELGEDATAAQARDLVFEALQS